MKSKLVPLPIKNWLSLLVISSALFFSACEKTHEPVPDKCKDAVRFEADFTTNETVGDSLIPTDKILLYSTVTLRPEEDYATYHWQIGNDQNVSTKKQYTVLFTELAKDVEVRLIATRPASKCFPDDKTIDTVYHSFSVVPWGDAAIIGRYVGSYSRTPNLVDTVEIKYAETVESPAPYGEFNVLNINRGCDIEKYPNGACPGWGRGYRAFEIASRECKKCPGTKGLVILKDTDKIEANLTYGDTTKWGSVPLPLVVDKFTGVRVSK